MSGFLRCACEGIFKDFRWLDLGEVCSSDLPDVPGVYAIRVAERGMDVKEVCRGFLSFLEGSKWAELLSYVRSRLARLERISACPILYIGSAPKSIRVRFKDLSGIRHTAFFPILALMLGGWKLQYGFLTVKSDHEAKELEKRLKSKYAEFHGSLPALVER